MNQYDFLNNYTDDDLFSVLEEISYEDFVTGSNEEEDIKINTASNMETKTSYKRMSTTLSKINNSRYKVSNAVTWSKTPKHRKSDIIGIGINSNTSPVPGTEYGRQFWSTMTGASTGEAIYTSASNKWNRDMDYGLYFKLKSNDAIKAPWTTIKMSMEYEITPNVINITKVDAFGHYSHQESYVNYTPSFDLPSGTLSISADISNKFSPHPKTHVQINN